MPLCRVVGAHGYHSMGCLFMAVCQEDPQASCACVLRGAPCFSPARPPPPTPPIVLGEPASGRKPTAVFAAHVGEALCLDWNKYIPSQLVTGGLDRTLRLWVCATIASEARSSCCVHWAVRFLLCVLGPFFFLSIVLHMEFLLLRCWCFFLSLLCAPPPSSHTSTLSPPPAPCHRQDCRKLDAPLLVMKGHTMGVKRVKCSPHSQYIFASSS